MDRHVPYQVLNLWTSAQGVRHITHVDSSARQVDKVLDRVRRVNAHQDAAKTRTLILPGGGDAQIIQRCSRLPGDVGNGQREARGQGGKQELRRLHAGVGTATGWRFVNPQLELTDPHRAAISPLPACCNLHNYGGI